MPESPGVLPGLAIVALLIVLAVGFGLRQWLDRHRRGPNLDVEDAHYYARQDTRRLAGSTLMLLIAAGMTWGLSIDPRANRGVGRLWGFLWLGISLLVLVLLVLALIDWMAIRGFAMRHRSALDAERRATIEAERRRRRDEAARHPADGANGPLST